MQLMFVYQDRRQEWNDKQIWFQLSSIIEYVGKEVDWLAI